MYCRSRDKTALDGVAANPPSYLRQTRAITSGENDCVSVLIRRVGIHGVCWAGRACCSGPAASALTSPSGGDNGFDGGRRGEDNGRRLATSNLELVAQ
jgi:hypothetical protein